QPHVFSDGRGSVWVAVKTRRTGPTATDQGRPRPGGFWEYGLTRFEGSGWSKEIALPSSKGRSSTRINAALTSNGGLTLTWPTDNRSGGYYYSPVRQEVFAGTVSAPSAAPGAPVWKTSADEPVEAKAGHVSEAPVLKALPYYVLPHA